MLLNCKFCGGELEITEGAKITTCKYCRTTQTLPVIKDEQSSNLFNRANALRRRCDFDKAEAAFEKIIESDGTEAEAYWGLVLSKYGIEYVEDPESGKMIPTCHRASYDSIVADGDYKSALEYADEERKALYVEQASEIDRIQKDILSLAEKEEKYDVFICYKETDENGKRTRDSATASEIYYELTDAGFKVFYAAETLQGKIGSEYEPIIFAALNSAKVMLVIGSKPEYFNAVWVKNEWSRFLKIMKNDRKKRLIPCYRDMDAYDLPEEFVHIQAQNMEKMAFLIDLIQGVKKVMESFKTEPVIVKEKETVVKETVVNNQTTVITDNGSSIVSAVGSNAAALLRRAFMFLEDGDFESADEYCEKVLDIEPENALGYLGKLLADLKLKTKEFLKLCKDPFDDNVNYKKAIRFGDDALKTELTTCIQQIKTRNQLAHMENLYLLAMDDYKSSSISRIEKAIQTFKSLSGFKDSNEKIKLCEEKIQKLREKEEAEKQEQERQAELERIAAEEKSEAERLENERLAELRRIEIVKKIKLKKKIFAIIAGVAIICFALAFFIPRFALPEFEYTLSDDRTYYSIKANKYRVKGDVVIPNTYNDLPVEEISDKAFLKCNNLTSVTIPDSIRTIGVKAFKDCSSLACVNFSEKSQLNSIGDDAFRKCTALTSITIPDSVTIIGINAFMYCEALESIELGSNVKTIGSSAFTYCYKLTNIVIPDSVTIIGDWAFEYCTELAEVTIGSGVTTIGEWTFADCPKLDNIYYTGTAEQWNTIKFKSNWRRNSGECKISRIPTLKYTFNADEGYFTVTGIGTYSDTTLVIPSTYNNKPVKSIADNAFYDCDILTNITIPDSITSIGNSAFFDCTNLTNVTIGNNVTTIGDSAFYNCTAITSLTLGNNVTTIGNSAFAYCNKLTTIKYKDSETHWNEILKGTDWDKYIRAYTILYNYTGE